MALLDNCVALQAAGRQQEWIQHEVVKIGKSENPARRFHEILGVFQNLGYTSAFITSY